MSAAADAPVVVGVGGSPQGLAAVRLAARAAAGYGRPLCVLHAFNWTAALEAPSVAGPRAEAEELIARATVAAAEVEPELTVSGQLAEGSAVTMLIRRSESAFLVVVGDGGMATRSCVPHDAPAVQLAARAGCPVLVVRSGPPPRGPVLVGIDGSASSHTALDFAFGIAARFGARLLVVRVDEPARDRSGPDPAHPADPADPTHPTHPAGSADALTDTVARYGQRYPTVATECHTIRGDPGIVLTEQSRSAQLAVVAARGDEPWRGMLGAVSQAVLYHSPAPTVIVRGVIKAHLHGP